MTVTYLTCRQRHQHNPLSLPWQPCVEMVERQNGRGLDSWVTFRREPCYKMSRLFLVFLYQWLLSNKLYFPECIVVQFLPTGYGFGHDTYLSQLDLWKHNGRLIHVYTLELILLEHNHWQPSCHAMRKPKQQHREATWKRTERPSNSPKGDNRHMSLLMPSHSAI
jgi:hypothetical protein